MEFRAKIFKLGNSVATYLPKEVYAKLELGKTYEFEVKEIEPVPTYCERKHKDRLVYARTCGCY